jgi:ABC-type multidrug transport system fused ATPase/permease subunit
MSSASSSSATDRWLRPLTFITVMILFTYWLWQFTHDMQRCNTSFVCAWHTPLISGITLAVLALLAMSGMDLCCVLCHKRNNHQHIRAVKSTSAAVARSGSDRVDGSVGIELSGNGPHSDLVSTSIGIVHADDIATSDGTCCGHIIAACDEANMVDDSSNTANNVSRRNRGKLQVMILMIASYVLVASIIMVVPAYTIFITASAVIFVLSLWCAIYIFVGTQIHPLSLSL